MVALLRALYIAYAFALGGYLAISGFGSAWESLETSSRYVEQVQADGSIVTVGPSESASADLFRFSENGDRPIVAVFCSSAAWRR